VIAVGVSAFDCTKGAGEAAISIAMSTW